MNKGVKTGIIIVAAVLAVSTLGYAIGADKFSKSEKTETTLQTTSDVIVSQNEENQTAVTQTTAVATTYTQPTTVAPTASSDKAALLGSWSDGAGMSGFEFFENGTVKVTYVNVTVPLINIPVNGNYNGTYTVSGDEITMSFSIYTATITNRYRFSVSDSQLTLTNLEDLKQTVYIRTFSDETTAVPTEEVSTSASSPAFNSEIAGSWVCGDRDIAYTFGDDGGYSVRYKKPFADIPSGTYDGIYIYDGDTLTVQFIVSDSKKTEKYECTQGKNSITLIDVDGNRFILVREGTGSVGASDVSDIIGKWSDGAGMSGYEFHEDGLVTATYVNLNIPVVNIPINGTYDGAYSVSGNTLSMSFSIYGKVIRRTFTFSVEGNALTLIDSGDGKKSTYLRG